MFNPCGMLSLASYAYKTTKYAKLAEIGINTVKFLPMIIPGVLQGIDTSSPIKFVSSIIIKKIKNQNPEPQKAPAPKPDRSFEYEVEAILLISEANARISEIEDSTSQYHVLGPIMLLDKDLQKVWFAAALKNYSKLRSQLSEETAERADSDKLLRCAIVQMYYRRKEEN